MFSFDINASLGWADLFVAILVVLLLVCAYMLHTKKSGFNMDGVYNPQANGHFNGVRSDAVGVSTFTGGYAAQAPNYTDNIDDLVDDLHYDSGLGAADEAHFFAADPAWAAFEAMVYPRLGTQLKARYQNASTAEQISVLVAAGTKLGVALPSAAPALPAPTKSGFDRNTSRFSTLASKTSSGMQSVSHLSYRADKDIPIY